MADNGVVTADGSDLARGAGRGAFLAGWRLMAIDGFEWDVPDTPENAAAFGYSGKSPGDADCPAFPKVRVVTVSECGSRAVVNAEIGGMAGKGAGEQALARKRPVRQQLEQRQPQIGLDPPSSSAPVSAAEHQSAQ